jgi:20S proteasome subunit alpha 6
LQIVVLSNIASVDQLVVHCLKALGDTLPQDKQLTIDNCSIGIVGLDHPFEMLESDRISAYIDMLGTSQVAPMETE